MLPSLIIFGIIVYWTIKKIRICCQSCKANRKHNIPNNEEDEDMEYILSDGDNWNADRIEHPDDYDEHHVQYVPYDLTVSPPEENNVPTTYGSINNLELTRTPSSNIDHLSTRGTQITGVASKRLSIPLHPKASEDVVSLADKDVV